MEWTGSGRTNIYRAGHKGKVTAVNACFSIGFMIFLLQVDITCITVGVGNYFYPDHLPVLGMSLSSG